MTFLAPLMLFGLLSVAIPPILHLLNRKEAKPVVFPAMEFLRRAYRKTARRLKMKQWLLLALRMLLFAAIALALSKPMWSPRVSGESNLHSSSDPIEGAHVILYDTSYPMSYELGYQERRTLLDVARGHALRALSETNGPAAIIVMDQEAQSLTQELSADHELLKEGVRALKETHHIADLDEAFTLAYRFLSNRPLNEPKQITILSTPAQMLNSTFSPPSSLGDVKVVQVDLTAELKAQLDGAKEQLNASERPVLSIRQRAKLANHAITDLVLSPAPQRGRGQWRIEVEVANFSDEAMNLWPIWVELEGEILVRGFLSLKPHERAIKRLYFKVESQKSQRPISNNKEQHILETIAKKGWVKLAPDSLKIDDQWPFWIESRPPIKLLALNGDPRPTPHQDELFYLERALAPNVLGGTQVRLESKPLMSAELKDEVLEGFDLILLANIPRPSEKLGQQLQSHLQAGGGVWLTPGARTDVEAWNRSLGDLLPRPLRGMRRAGDAAAVEERGVARLSEFREHRLLTPFNDPQRSSLALAAIHQYFLFDPQPSPLTKTVVTLNEGSPYIMTRRVGEGRVVLWAGPIDREWGDLVIRPDFVPLAAETIRYLNREISGTVLSKALSDRLQLELSGEGPFSALSPSGERLNLTRAAKRSNSTDKNHSRRGWVTPALSHLGHYQIVSSSNVIKSASSQTTERLANDAEQIIRRFVVHLNVSESDLQQRNIDPQHSSETEEQVALTTMGALGQRQELWHIGLIGLFLFMLLEGVTLYQRREESRLS